MRLSQKGGLIFLSVQQTSYSSNPMPQDISVEHQCFNIKDRSIEIKHRDTSIEYRGSNIKHRSTSIEYRDTVCIKKTTTKRTLILERT